MNENELADKIAEALDIMEEEETIGLDRIRTFEADGVLTNNAGLTITVDGKRFQVTVVEA